MLCEIVPDFSFDSLKNIDRQIDGLTDQWTYRLSYRDMRMHIESLVYLNCHLFAKTIDNP